MKTNYLLSVTSLELKVLESALEIGNGEAIETLLAKIRALLAQSDEDEGWD